MLHCTQDVSELEQHRGKVCVDVELPPAWLWIPANLNGFKLKQTKLGHIVDPLGDEEKMVIVQSGTQTISANDRICPVCGAKMHVNASNVRTLTHIPLGGCIILIEVETPQLQCPHCKRTRYVKLPYESETARITKDAEAYIRKLLARQEFSNTAISELTGVCRNTIKRIDVKRLKELYVETDDEGHERLKKPAHNCKYLAIDEFLLHHNKIYATHIIDLETGEILWIQRGKKKQVVYDFIEHVGLEWMKHVTAVACDMNSDFEEAFREKCPHIEIVFDHFHIVKYLNEKVIDPVRKDEVERLNDAGLKAEAAKFKRTKYLLMMSASTRKLNDEKAEAGETKGTESGLFNLTTHKIRAGTEERYRNLIENNEQLLAIDLIKEILAFAYGSSKNEDGVEVYNCNTPEEMKKQMDEIIETCKGTKNKHFLKFAKMLEDHMHGIVTFAAHHIASGKIEGVNSRIKTLRRISYGISDDEYFFLKLIDMSRSKLAEKNRAAARRAIIEKEGFRKASKRYIEIEWEFLVPTELTA